MFFAGVPLASLLTAFGVAAALVIGLYILKLRRRPVAVPFARIWDSILGERVADQLFSRLKRLLSLLLQLVLITLLLLALGDPRPKASALEGRHLVVLVDVSASMKAVDVKPSRLEAAKGKLHELVRSLGSADRALLVEMGSVPSPISTMSADLTELEPAIDRLRAVDARANVEQALSFALDSLQGLAKPEIVLVSDGALGDLTELGKRVALGNVALSYLRVGQGADNVAISEFSVRRYPLDKSRAEVMLEVANTNDHPAQIELTLLGDGNVIDVTKLALGPNERLPRFYPDLAGASHTLEAKIKLADGRQDDLPADDHAYALVPERHRARVLLVTRGNTYLEAALLLDEYLDVTQAAPDRPLPEEHFDVAILDGVAPPLPAGVAAALYIDPSGSASPVALGKEIKDFGFDTWDKKSGALRYLALGDVQVSHGHALVPKEGDKVLGASELGPIFVSGVRSGRRFFALGFDPRSSDWVLRVAWPLFVLNCINDFVEDDTGYLSSFRTGTVWQIPAPTAGESVNLIDPSGGRHVVPVKEGRAIYRGEQAGFYKLVGAEGEGSSEFAANLSDLEESRIEPASELALGGKRSELPDLRSRRASHELWAYLLATAVALSILEWLSYHRRVTV